MSSLNQSSGEGGGPWPETQLYKNNKLKWGGEWKGELQVEETHLQSVGYSVSYVLFIFIFFFQTPGTWGKSRGGSDGI